MLFVVSAVRLLSLMNMLLASKRPVSGLACNDDDGSRWGMTTACSTPPDLFDGRASASNLQLELRGSESALGFCRIFIFLWPCCRFAGIPLTQSTCYGACAEGFWRLTERGETAVGRELLELLYCIFKSFTVAKIVPVRR